MIKKFASVFMMSLFVMMIFVNTSVTTYARTTLKIVKAPSSVTVAVGQTAKTTVKVKGNGVKYTWYYKNKNSSKYKKSAIKKNTYSVKMTNSVDGRKVYCKITDKYGSKLKTKTVTLSKGKKLKITKNVASVTVPSGMYAKVPIKVSGDGVKYTWYYKNKNSTKYKKSAIKSNTYSVKMTGGIAGRKVYCVVTDKYGVKIKSKTATLSMGKTLKIVKQPMGVFVDCDKIAATTVTVSGDGVKYTWYYKDATASGYKKSAITSNTYSVKLTNSINGRKVYCVITDKYGKTVKTNEVVLSIIVINPDDTETGGKTWEEVLRTMPTSLNGTTVEMFNWNSPSEYTGAAQVIEEFETQTGIDVKWTTVNYSQYFTKLPALIASGENIPDMVRCKGPLPSFMINLQPVNEIGYDFSDEAWDKGIVDLYRYGNNTYAISLQNTHMGTSNVIFYNKALIKKYNYQDPYTLWKQGKWDWYKYIEMCEDFKLKTGNAGSCGEGFFNIYTAAHGLKGAISYDGTKFYNAMSEPKFLGVHQILGDLYNKDKIFALGRTNEFEMGNHLFATGTTIHLRKTNYYYADLKETNDLGVVPVPKILGQDTYYQGVGEAEAYGIAKGANNPTAVPYFLRYFLDAKNYDLTTYYGDNQNLDVYNWCQRQKNKIYSYGYPAGMSNINDDYSILYQKGSQMLDFINANTNRVDSTVNEYNATLEYLKD